MRQLRQPLRANPKEGNDRRLTQSKSDVRELREERLELGERRQRRDDLERPLGVGGGGRRGSATRRKAGDVVRRDGLALGREGGKKDRSALERRAGLMRNGAEDRKRRQMSRSRSDVTSRPARPVLFLPPPPLLSLPSQPSPILPKPKSRRPTSWTLPAAKAALRRSTSTNPTSRRGWGGTGSARTGSWENSRSYAIWRTSRTGVDGERQTAGGSWRSSTTAPRYLAESWVGVVDIAGRRSCSGWTGAG